MSGVHKAFLQTARLSGERYGWLNADSRSAREFGRAGRGLVVASALLVGDLLACHLALSTVRIVLGMAHIIPESAATSGLPIVAQLLVFLALGLYSSASRSPYSRFRARGLGILLFVAMNGIASIGTAGVWSLVAIGVCDAALLLVAGFYVELLVRNALIRHGFWTAPTALVGCGEGARRLFQSLAAEPELGLKPVGFVRTSDDEAVHDSDLPGPVLGAINDLEHFADRFEVAILTSRKYLAEANFSAGRLPPTQLILGSDIQDVQTLWLRVRPLGYAVGIQIQRAPFLCQNRIMKRAIDLTIAVPAALLFLPVVALFALLVALADRGSPFFAQQRVGERGRLIMVPKLRTMYLDATERLEEYLRQNPDARDEWERYFKLTNDPRVIPWIGRVMRRFSIDELPQIWSIIVGEMSLVGPRPFPSYHVTSFDREFQAIRSAVPPGLTGLWQVTARSDGDLEVQRALDLSYIRNWSVLLDLYIILQTVPAVVTARGAK